MSNIRKVLLVTLLLFVTTGVQAANIDNPLDLEIFFGGLITNQMEEFNVPGVTLAIVKDGEIVLAKGYGHANLEQKIPMDAKTSLVRPGSASKLFVWTAVMQQVEAGRIDLNTDINEYLDFPIPAKLATDKASQPDPITMHHLMNHTAGFEDQVEHLFVNDISEVHPLGEYLRNYVPARIAAPGEQMAYSNYGTSLAAYIVEWVSGQSFAEYVEEHIFTPLGMNQSTFRQPVPEALADQVAVGYAYQNGEYIPGEFELVQSYPAGSLSSTATDMARFMMAHLQHGQLDGAQIMAEETATQMHSQSYTQHPMLPGVAHGFLVMQSNGRRILSHGGDTFLFHSGVFLIPEENVGLFISYNGFQSALARMYLMAAFMDRYYPPMEKVALEPNLELVERADLYNGTYYMNRTNVTTYEALMRMAQGVEIRVDEEGYLVQTLMGLKIRYVEVEENVFYAPEQGWRMVAELDEDGQVAQFYTDSPFQLIPTPWYESVGFTGILWVGYVLLVLATLVGWLISFWRKGRRLYRHRSKRVVKGVALLFGLGAIGLLVSLVLVLADVHPAWGVPNLILEETSAMSRIIFSSRILLVVGLVLIWKAVEVWRRRDWDLWGRLHYTIYTGWSVAIIWWFYHWNLM